MFQRLEMPSVEFTWGTLPRTLSIEHTVTLGILKLWLYQDYIFIPFLFKTSIYVLQVVKVGKVVMFVLCVCVCVFVVGVLFLFFFRIHVLIYL